MSSFSDALGGRARKPAAVVVLPPSAFADDWRGKPTEDVAVGLRLVSEADVQTARAQAARFAVDLFVARDGGCTDRDARDDAFADALMRWIVARAACDPNDVSLPYFEAAEDTVRFALTSEGVRRIWDSYVQLHVASGVAYPEADDNGIHELSRLLTTGALEHLSRVKAREVRKLLGYCLELLRNAA